MTGHKQECLDAAADEGGGKLSTKGKNTHQGTQTTTGHTFTPLASTRALPRI